MRFVSSIATLFAAGAAQAACPGYTQLELNECAASDYQAADQRLNEVFRAVKAMMDDMGHGPAMLNAQRKWLAYRDAACAVETAIWEGGSIQPLMAYTRLTRIARARTQDLENLGN
jgi:uncharacterized protein YecT (DUF1311 family)